MKSRLMLDTKVGKYDATDQPRYEAVKFAFTNAYQGKGLKWLAKRIREQGWRSRYSEAPLSVATIRTWLINPAYTGYMVWNRVKFYRKNGKRNYKHNPISQWVFSPEPSHPAIIDKNLFETVAMKFLRKEGRLPGRPLSDQPPGAGPGRNSTRYLLSGFLECSACKANYVTVKVMHQRKTSIVYFGCNAKERWGKNQCDSKRINLAVAEGVVLDTLFNQLLTEETIKQFVAAFNEFSEKVDGAASAEQEVIQKQMLRVSGELTNMKEAILKGVDPTTFVAELQDRQRLMRQLEEELARITADSDVQRLVYDESRLGAWIEVLRRTLLTADFDTRREMLRRFIKKIEVNPDRTAKMTWDLPATLSWRNDQQVPSAVSQLSLSSPTKGITLNGCGGRICPRLQRPRTSAKRAGTFRMRRSSLLTHKQKRRLIPWGPSGIFVAGARIVHLIPTNGSRRYRLYSCRLPAANKDGLLAGISCERSARPGMMASV